MRPQSPEDAQATFDRVVAGAGLSQGAPSGDKLAAIRSLTTTQLQISLRSEIARPNWDSEWFIDQRPTSSLEDPRPFSSWIKGVVIGCAKEESSLFCPEWNSLTGAEGQRIIKQAFGDGELATEILDTYDIPDDNIAGSAVDSLIRLTTDGLFGVARDIASAHSEVPVSLYVFEQTDTFDVSPYKGRSFHSLGNSMFFRLPTVAGHTSDTNMKITSNAMCEAAVILAYGQQPWKPFVQSKEMMVFNGKNTGLRKVKEPPQWYSFVQTREREEAFKAGCLSLILAGMKMQQVAI